MSRVVAVPFPLRSDFVATVWVPRDMTKAEAERVAAFVKALAAPPDSEDTRGGEGDERRGR